MARYKLVGEAITGVFQLTPGKFWLFWRGRKLVRVPSFIVTKLGAS